MDFPKELWDLPEHSKVLVVWTKDFSSVPPRKEGTYEWAHVSSRRQQFTVLMDLDGHEFTPSEYSNIFAIRVAPPEEEMAIRMGIIKTEVT